MKKLKYSIARLLIIAMLASCVSITACGNQSDDDPDSVSADDTNSESEETTADIYSGLPEGDFDGEEFIFGTEHESGWALTLVDAEELNGELINDTVYKRNRLVEERLNVKIKAISYSPATQLRDAYRNGVTAGDDPYDVACINAYFTAPMILEGSFIEAHELGLDLDKPWWNKMVMDSLTYAGKTYSLAGDISMVMWDASMCFMFNETMSDDLQLANQYDLVRSGKWTLDEAEKGVIATTNDVNGNTRVDFDDTFGLNAYSNLVCSLIISGGETLVGTDDHGLPKFDGLSQGVIDRFSKIYDIFYGSDASFIGACDGGKVPSGKGWSNVFTEGRALYYFEPFGACMTLRNVDFEYGFLPLPKYDEQQENYITPVNQNAHIMHISKSHTDDLDMIVAVLENLGAESYKSIRPAYFENVLQGKRAQDENDREMMEIMFGNQVMYIEAIYGWGNLASIINDAAQYRRPDIVSQVASALPKIQSDIQKTIDFYSNN